MARFCGRCTSGQFLTVAASSLLGILRLLDLSPTFTRQFLARTVEEYDAIRLELRGYMRSALEQATAR